MKALIAASGLMLMPPCERPPVEYQGDSVPAVVMFAHPGVVHEVCSRHSTLRPGYIALACTNPANGRMLLPDPCLFDDGYGRLVCHEKAHLNRPDGSPGWRHAGREEAGQ